MSATIVASPSPSSFVWKARQFLSVFAKWEKSGPATALTDVPAADVWVSGARGL